MTISPTSLFAMTSSVAPGDSADTKTGNVTDSKDGNGTFVTMLSNIDGHKTIDKTVTYADGTTKSTERVVTINSDGSKTISRTDKNGQTSTIQETKTKNDDGTISISKEITNSDGSLTEVAETVTKTDGEVDRSITLTNAAGQTETLDRQMVQDGSTTTYTTTGTGYDGHQIDRTSTWTVLT